MTLTKRSILLIITSLFLVLTIISTYSQDEIGCCHAPGPNTCYTSIQSDCHDTNSWTLTPDNDCNPAVIPECTFTPGCCISTCTDASYAAECADYQEEPCSQQSECQSGCCFCVADPEDPTKNTCFSDLTADECTQECTDRQMPITFLDTDLDALACESQCDSISPEKGTISGIVVDQTGTPVPSAVLTAAGITQTSAQDGSYSFTEIYAGSITIETSKTGYTSNVTSLLLQPNEDLTLNIQLKPSPGGSISGIIKDAETLQPISGVLVIATDILSYTTQTDESGYYEITDLDAGNYTLTASKDPNYFPESFEINLTETNKDISKNINLAAKPIGILKGTVTDTDGNSIFAELYINIDEYKTFTDESGYYEITVLADITSTDYIIQARAPGFINSLPIQIYLSSNQQLTTDITLMPYSSECIYPASPQPDSFTASHVKGNKAISLTWQSPLNCHSNIAGYTIFRQLSNSVEELVFLSVSDIPYNHPTQYTDENVSWQTEYNYWIIVTYNDQVVRNSTPLYSLPITTGDEECENKYIQSLDKFTEFCLEDYFRQTCDSNNQLIEAPFRVAPTNSPTYCRDEGESFFCSGPDSEGYTYCKDSGACSPIIQEATPFGLYYTEEGCYGNDYENYCYFDYSDTPIDSCFQCSQDLECYDYKSEDACLIDNCNLGHYSECKWLPTEFSEFGKGICYRENYNESDYCGLCSSTSPIFQNTGCTEEVCKALGDCYSAGDSCMSCTGESSCESYTTRQSCIGTQEFNIVHCTDQTTPSNDACGFGVCKWNPVANICYKDGNDNNKVDCGDDYEVASPQCLSDTQAPTTTPPSEYITANKNTEIVFTTDDGKVLTYCIDHENTCCPTEPINFEDKTARIIPSQSQTLRGAYYTEGFGKDTYYIRYYSTDWHYNQEQLKSATALIDLDPPKINVLTQLIPNTSVVDRLIHSNLTFNITLSEFSECTDYLQNLITKSKESKLSNQQGEEWFVSYDVKDGNYKYEITCTDDLGNINTTTIDNIEVDAWKYIKILAPTGPIKNTEVEFRVETLETGTCQLYRGLSNEGAFATTANLYHRTTKVLETNTHYSDFYAECEDENGRIDQGLFFFTIDNIPPLTTIILRTEGKESRYNTTWNVWLNQDFSISFECNDPLPASYGCSRIRYCVVPSGQETCTPVSTPPEALTFSDTTTICYYSEDRGGNIEPKKCSTAHVGEGLGIIMKTPKYNVSNIPIYDLEVEVQRDSVECKWGQIDFEYELPYIQTMDKTSFNVYEIPNFDKTSPPNPEIFPLHIKCKDSLGFANDIPTIINILYDSTAPILKQKYADPSHVVQGSSTSLNTVTDDKTICKYDLTESSFSSMRGLFPGYSDWNTGNPQFSLSHKASIPLTMEDHGKTYTYYVACQNRAGDISQTSTITFDIDFFESGTIIEYYPSGTIAQNQIKLGLKTSKDALCSYRVGDTSFTQFPITGATFHNTTTAMTLPEGSHDFPVRCLFLETTREGIISFIVDLTKPSVKSVNISSRICYDENLNPEFIVEDELSSISTYNYSLYEVISNAILINWTSTTSSDPSINTDNLNLSLTKKYYIKMTAMDAAGNPGDKIVKSNDFALISQNSTECINDKDAPEITIETEVVSNGIKVTMLCADELGCSTKYYGTSKTNSTCNATSTYSNPVILKQTTRFCWKVSDTVGNIASGSKIITMNDKDGDGVPDDKDLCPNTRYGASVDSTGCPINKDEDSDGVPDIDDICPETLPEEEVDLNGCSCSQRDTDQDNINDCLDKCPGTPLSEIADTEGCSNCQKDSDNDGMSDCWEKQNNLDPNNGGDRNKDPDNDKLTNYEEYLYFKQTGRFISARSKDTDNDGYSDFEEISQNFDPTNPDSHPSGSAFAIILIILGILLILTGAGYLVYMEYYAKPSSKPYPLPPIQPTPLPQSYPTIDQIQAVETRRQMLLSVDKRRKEKQRKREETFAKRRTEKSQKRSSFFNVFGKSKKQKIKSAKVKHITPAIPVMPGKLLPKKVPPYLAAEKPIKITKPTKTTKEEFRRLEAAISDYHKQKGKLIEIKKKPKQDEFERLHKLIEEKIHHTKSLKLTPEEKVHAKDIFDRLSQMKKRVSEAHKEKIKIKATKKKEKKKSKQKESVFKRLDKLNSKGKKPKQPFNKLAELKKR